MTVTTGDDYVTVDTLLSSVPPTTIRLHHKPDIVNICACGSLVLLGMIVSPVAIVTCVYVVMLEMIIGPVAIVTRGYTRENYPSVY